MNTEKITNVIKNSFQDTVISMQSLLSPKNKTVERPFSPMRNKKGTFDVPVYVAILSKPFTYNDHHITATHATINLQVLLTDCSYSHETGFVWGGGDDDFAILDVGTMNKITLYNNGVEINNVSSECDQIIMSSLDNKNTGLMLAGEMVARSNHTDIINVFKHSVSDNSRYKVKS